METIQKNDNVDSSSNKEENANKTNGKERSDSLSNDEETEKKTKGKETSESVSNNEEKEKTKGMERSDSASNDKENANKTNGNEKSPDTLTADHEMLQSAHLILQERLLTANAHLKEAEVEKANMKSDLVNLTAENEKLKAANLTLEKSLTTANTDLKEAEGEKANMKEDLLNLTAENEKLKADHLTLEESLTTANTAFKTYEEEKANMKKTLDTVTDNYEMLQSSHLTLQERLMTVNLYLNEAKEEMANMKSDLANLTALKQKFKAAYLTLKEKLTTANGDLKKSEEEKANMKKDFEEFWDQYEQLKATNKVLNEQLTSSNADIDKLKDKVACQDKLWDHLDKYVKSQEQNAQFTIPNSWLSDQRHTEEIKRANQVAKEFRKMRSNLTAAVEEKGKTKKQYENKYKALWDEYQKLQSDKTTVTERLRKSEAYIRQLEGDIKKLKQATADMDNLRQEKDNLLTRLSKLIGDRLTHDNPNIADLSDSDRPTKLSEFFSEMYDNEWTDAFEELTEELSLSDDHAIGRLLDILMNSFRKCKEITWDRYESLSLIASTLQVTEEGIASTRTTDAQTALTGAQYLNTTKGPETKSKNEPSIRDGEANPLTDESGDNTQNEDHGEENQENGQGAEGQKQESDDNTQNENHGEDNQENGPGAEGQKQESDDNTQNENHGEDNQENGPGAEGQKQESGDNTQNEDHVVDNQENGQGAEGQKQDSGDSKQTEDQVVDNQDNGAGADGKIQKNAETKTTMLSSALSIEEKTSLKNIWRSSTISLRNESLTMIYTMLSTRFCTPETNLPKTCKYLKVCCDVCWKMFMQEKPMYLEINAEKEIDKDKLFDTERFKAYTKVGKYVAYVVWPALFLHEGGPMLSKGIAQGCNKVPNT